MQRKYPALEAVMQYAMENKVRGPIFKLAAALDRKSIEQALYDLINFANASGFTPQGLGHDINKILDNKDFDEVRRIAQSLLSKQSFFIF